ncbi:MAG TPA: 5-oxoprolinase subunit PxpA [Nitrospiraceae bacterium]|nr:5-oxoprolinase subunit PxpA [Nitrospiraceae bacterium]
MMTRIDLNSDMGERETPEGLAIDAALMPFITSVNIACGSHAGTPALMRRTAQLAAQQGVAIGAHPGLLDPEHFGRAERIVAPDGIETLVIRQLDLLAEVLDRDGLTFTHVKPHGALYNKAATDPELARAIVRAVQAVERTLLLYALAGSELVAAARAAGLAVVNEAFVDRAYRADGSLVPRSERGAVLETEDAVRRQLRQLMTGVVTSIEGSPVTIQADSLCLHSDTPQAVALARVVRQELAVAGILVAAARTR